jgi:hypothetical protein
MKKIILFVAVVSAISFASCKKDRTCTCTTTTSAGGSSTSVVKYDKAKKGDARSQCLSYTTTGTGYTTTTTCDLK